MTHHLSLQRDLPSTTSSTLMMKMITMIRRTNRISRSRTTVGILLSIGLGALAPAAAGDILFVDAGAAPGGNGASWATAFTSVQKAIDAAVATSGADEIWIAEGTYVPEKKFNNNEHSKTFLVPANVSIYGGFAGDERSIGERDIALHPTILSADLLQNDNGSPASEQENVTNVIRVLTPGPRTLDGLILRDARVHIDSGGHPGKGLAIEAGSVTLRHSIVESNDGDWGGGIGVTLGGFLLMDSCLIRGNSATIAGGGLWIENATAILLDSKFDSNSCEQQGTACRANGGTLVATGCSFEGQTGSSTGLAAVFTGAASALVSECSFRENLGGGFACVNGASAVHLCEFVDNRGGLALGVSESDLPSSVSSCLLRNNQRGLSVFQTEATVSACTFERHRTDGEGAALIVSQASVTVTGCTFQYNRALNGSAIRAEASPISVRDCLVQGNYGGAVAILNGSEPSEVRTTLFQGNGTEGASNAILFTKASNGVVEECVFRGNGALNTGAVLLSVGTGIVRRCLFESNTTPQGGALYLGGPTGQTGARVADCRFVGNSSDATGTGQGGGAVYVANGTHQLQNCFIAGNKSLSGGGGVHVQAGGHLTLELCTIVNNASGANQAALGGGLFAATGTGTTIALRNSILWGNGNSSFGNQVSVPAGVLTVDFTTIQGWNGSLGGTGNNGLNPLFVGIAGADAIIGTADDVPFLLAKSPAIDSGSNELVGQDAADLDGDGNFLEAVPLDLAEGLRIVGTVDRGAVERQATGG